MYTPDIRWSEEETVEQSQHMYSAPRHAERIEDFLKETAFHAGRREKDPYISNAAAAMLLLYEEHDGFRGLVKQAAYQRPISPTYMFNLWLKEIQVHYIDDDSYPYETVEEYAESICELIRYPDNRSRFLEDVTSHELQSNISERYKAARIAIEALKPRLGCMPTLLDIGTSVGNGLKQLAFMPFNKICLLPPEGIGAQEVALVELQINTILQPFESTSLAIGYGVGLDIIEPTDVSRYHARSDSFNPSELKDRNKLAQYDVLEIAEPPNVVFEYKDLLAGESLEHTPPEGFDLVTMFTMLYQIKPSDRQKFLQKSIDLLSGRGLLLVTDFAEPNPQDPKELLFYDNWYAKPFRYRTMLFDPLLPEYGFQVLFEWRDGRATEMRPASLGWQLLKAM